MSALSMMPKVVEVLRWYADASNYAGSLFDVHPSGVTVDAGEQARTILAELEKDGQA